MSAYYNEHDPFAAAWLRELIREGLIADGEVDTRDIQTVQADDLKGFTQCHFFAGIGGWSLALRLAGWDDARPVWTGSCPCQPFSAAGKREGGADDRHLWPHWSRLIRECRPVTIFGEQVESAVAHGWLDAVFDDLEREGYTCGSASLPAASVGAPHLRQRVWFVADRERDRRREERADGGRQSVGDRPEGLYSGLESGGGFGELAESSHADRRGRERRAEAGTRTDGERGRRSASGGPDGAVSAWADALWLPCRDGKARPVEPRLVKISHGTAAGMGLGGRASEQTVQAEEVDGSQRVAGAEQGMSMVRDDPGASSEGREGVRGSGLFRSTAILQPGLHGGMDGGTHQTTDTSEQSPAECEGRQAPMRTMRIDQPAACPSSGPQSAEQCPRQPPDVVRALPQSAALAELERDHATAEALQVLFASSAEARTLLYASDSLEAAWASLGEEGQGRLIVAIREAGLGMGVVHPLIEGAKNRVGRLRGYGNAIVPQVAAEFIAAYREVMDALSD